MAPTIPELDQTVRAFYEGRGEQASDLIVATSIPPSLTNALCDNSKNKLKPL
jgi:hypothetical protein